MEGATRAGATVALSLAVALASLSRPAHALERDEWFGPDKTKHFVASAGIAGAGYLLTLPFTDDDIIPFVVGGGVAAAAGFGKELYDLARGSYVSGRDLVWDGLGILTGLLIAWTLDELFDLHAAARADARRDPSMQSSTHDGAPWTHPSGDVFAAGWLR